MLVHFKPHRTIFKELLTESAVESTTDSVKVGRLALSNMFNILNPLESADGNRPTIAVSQREISPVGTGLKGAFSMISWLFINQTRHYTYQTKAEYLSYHMVSIISLWITMLYMKYIVTKILIFTNNFLNVNIAHNLVKLSLLILDMSIQGNVSQNFELCPSFHFMSLRNDFYIFFKQFPDFWHKIRNKTNWKI